MSKRPSPHELSRKLQAAKSAVKNKQVGVVNDLACTCEAIELGYDFGSELHEVLEGLLEETTPQHYQGKRPPAKSYEDQVKDLELFPFVVASSRFKRKVYVKFCMNQDFLWIVSLHADRPEKG